MHATTLIADNGIYIPRDMLPVGGEWIITLRSNYEIVLRPKLSKAEAHRRARERRERLREQFGVLPDSTPLIREDRDSR